MWIVSQGNRLINTDKIESMELASRRETTAGTVAYEIIARTAGVGQGTPHILARLTEEQPGHRLFEEIKQAIVSDVPLYDIPAVLKQMGL